MLPRTEVLSKRSMAEDIAATGHSSEIVLSATIHDPRSQHTKDFAGGPRTATPAEALNDHSARSENTATRNAHQKFGNGTSAGSTKPAVMIGRYKHKKVGARTGPSFPAMDLKMLPKRNWRQRPKPRKRQHTPAENDLFTSFKLSRDPESSDYLPYDEVVYPKMFNRPAATSRSTGSLMAPVHGALVEGSGKCNISRLGAAAELDSMWMVGFVDNSRRHKKNILLRELEYFVRLPDSTVLPGAQATLDTISQIRTPTSFSSLTSAASATYDQNSTRRAWPGYMAKGGSKGVKDDDSFEDDAEDAGSREGKSALTSLENLRLRELEKRLYQASVGVREERRKAGIRAYAVANRKLRKILSGARPPAVGPSLKSEGLESILRRGRDELSATIRIQRFYKIYYRRNKFDKMIRQLCGVVRIQARARGVIARRYVAEWHSRRSVMVLAWQTVIRRMLSNIRWRKRLEVENRAASRLQSAARGRAGRAEARRTRGNLAALRIQCLWRGSVDRAKADRLWLDILATRVQGLARMMVAKREVDRMRRIHNGAAETIQRCFRGAAARRAMTRMIWKRNMGRRLDFLRGLAAEESWERENFEITQRRGRRARLEERLEEALAAESTAHAAVFDLESNEKMLETQRLMLSPRALQQGWKEELDGNIEQHHGWITERKLEAVFGGSLPARELEEELKQRKETLDKTRRRATQLADWRDMEIRGIFDSEARRRFDDKHLDERRKAADEKRKWAVSHVTHSGKPDKMKARRRSRPSEAFEDPVEGVLKQVFTGGSVDLFANDHSPDEELREVTAKRRRAEVPTSARTGAGGAGQEGLLSKTGTLEKVVARLKLQTHVNQVAQFEEIMRPAQDIVSTLGLEPLFERERTRQAHRGASVMAPSAESSSGQLLSPCLESPMSAPVAGVGRVEEDRKIVAGAQERVVTRNSPWQESPKESTTCKNAERASAAGFPDRYGAAASLPPGRPPAVGTGGTPVPIEWGEEERVRARQRQRRLHMLAAHDRPTTPMTCKSDGSSSARLASRVPWQLLDELEAEKRKLRLHKIWSGDGQW